jgi:hypothetical protein
MLTASQMSGLMRVTVAGGIRQQRLKNLVGLAFQPYWPLLTTRFVVSRRAGCNFYPSKHCQQWLSAANVARTGLKPRRARSNRTRLKRIAYASFWMKAMHCVTRELNPYKRLMVRWAESDTKNCIPSRAYTALLCNRIPLVGFFVQHPSGLPAQV